MTSSATYSGKMSVFGGPHDPGVAADESLALCQSKEVGLFSGVFLSEQPEGTTGLARRLDPNAHYIAMRWDYSKTPRSYLQGIKVGVTANGKTEQAHPIDWGPNEKTERIADLSPGLASALGLQTDQTCTIEVPLPDSLPIPIPPSSVHTPPEGQLHAMPQTMTAFDAAYGHFSYTEGSTGDINIDPAWIAANIVEADIPQLHKFTRGKPIQCHRLVADDLKAVFADIEKAGKLDLILSYDGLWVPRHKNHDPRRGISLHSDGTAIDINAEWNPYGSPPKPAGEKGSCVELIPFFQQHWFAWGGYFGGGHAADTDGMHFEYVPEAFRPSAPPTGAGTGVGAGPGDGAGAGTGAPSLIQQRIDEMSAKIAAMQAHIDALQAKLDAMQGAAPSAQPPSVLPVPSPLLPLLADVEAFLPLLPVIARVMREMKTIIKELGDKGG
jgi:hypothetical protein